MFSGEWRKIKKSDVKITDYNITVPTSTSLRNDLFNELTDIENYTLSKADEKYPYDFEKNIDYDRNLLDQHKLIIMRKYEVQQPAYIKIVVEGIQNNW